MYFIVLNNLSTCYFSFLITLSFAYSFLCLNSVIFACFAFPFRVMPVKYSKMLATEMPRGNYTYFHISNFDLYFTFKFVKVINQSSNIANLN